MRMLTWLRGGSPEVTGGSLARWHRGVNGGWNWATRRPSPHMPDGYSDVIPPVDEWNNAVTHSLAFPAHILGPYLGDDGEVHMDCCDCRFDSARLPMTGRCVSCGLEVFRWSDGAYRTVQGQEEVCLATESQRHLPGVNDHADR